MYWVQSYLGGFGMYPVGMGGLLYIHTLECYSVFLKEGNSDTSHAMDEP